jgi:cytochrome c
MKFPILFTSVVIASASAGALASPELARSKNCVACHAAAAKLVGPSFKDIASKYASADGAAEKLAQKIQKGSQGVWGPVPMPPNSQVKSEEALSLARWILSQK